MQNIESLKYKVVLAVQRAIKDCDVSSQDKALVFEQIAVLSLQRPLNFKRLRIIASTILKFFLRNQVMSEIFLSFSNIIEHVRW